MGQTNGYVNVALAGIRGWFRIFRGESILCLLRILLRFRADGLCILVAVILQDVLDDQRDAPVGGIEGASGLRSR